MKSWDEQMDADAGRQSPFLLSLLQRKRGHFSIFAAAPDGLSKHLAPLVCSLLHPSLDNSLCILNKDFILPTRRKLLTRCSWACRYLISFYCCMGVFWTWNSSPLQLNAGILQRQCSLGLIYSGFHATVLWCPQEKHRALKAMTGCYTLPSSCCTPFHVVPPWVLIVIILL